MLFLLTAVLLPILIVQRYWIMKEIEQLALSFATVYFLPPPPVPATLDAPIASPPAPLATVGAVDDAFAVDFALGLCGIVAVVAVYVLAWRVARFGLRRLLSCGASAVAVAVRNSLCVADRMISCMYGLVLLVLCGVYVCCLLVVLPAVYLGGLGVICFGALATHLLAKRCFVSGLGTHLIQGPITSISTGLGTRPLQGPILTSTVTGLGSRPIQGPTNENSVLGVSLSCVRRPVVAGRLGPLARKPKPFGWVSRRSVAVLGPGVRPFGPTLEDALLAGPLAYHAALTDALDRAPVAVVVPEDVPVAEPVCYAGSSQADGWCAVPPIPAATVILDCAARPRPPTVLRPGKHFGGRHQAIPVPRDLCLRSLRQRRQRQASRAAFTRAFGRRPSRSTNAPASWFCPLPGPLAVAICWPEAMQVDEVTVVPVTVPLCLPDTMQADDAVPLPIVLPVNSSPGALVSGSSSPRHPALLSFGGTLPQCAPAAVLAPAPAPAPASLPLPVIANDCADDAGSDDGYNSDSTRASGIVPRHASAEVLAHRQPPSFTSAYNIHHHNKAQQLTFVLVSLSHNHSTASRQRGPAVDFCPAPRVGVGQQHHHSRTPTRPSGRLLSCSPCWRWPATATTTISARQYGPAVDVRPAPRIGVGQQQPPPPSPHANTAQRLTFAPRIGVGQQQPPPPPPRTPTRPSGRLLLPLLALASHSHTTTTTTTTTAIPARQHGPAVDFCPAPRVGDGQPQPHHYHQHHCMHARQHGPAVDFCPAPRVGALASH
ncbi:hypothetical protein DM01DRAFT_1376805 [Hesseltinella vesiculosa]|uniref:Uncharacterized protein n=1 Tax=Hesseltinella vesiculosa TaxID=101127 RepID=A0A1X2GA40_9FUNG|nr:hypothetical protein DM01DRAFT_1376805 [Hesseltinella vesiculosa]